MKLLMSFAIGLSPLLAGGSAVVENGHAIYQQRCLFCHGTQGEGNPGFFKTIGKAVVDFRAQQTQNLSDAQMHDRILKGGKDRDGKMPAFETLDERQVANVIAFIRSLRSK